ncbi:Uncharacterised protein [Mycobacterium tuberculosis]|uniref:Uncharacterized protein n=1 Tax=Mycobacterium tuberculosis TaxID=1773 RepID=A0A655JQ02_MYCTX|nr:Uncharacterised protein [Mycobacterium tuberculosis]CKS92918.1 Uncharacterised protein [Mycobacterium tuberculosis]CNM00548.1 Uncharacterised protein [Mycobacterium tuberculosis]CNM52015.1 Uncharacterised protein [Mycobacterium tuberculosis]CNM56164.1 Uncharacterised protein [Mycobacterium tuberculosis]
MAMIDAASAVTSTVLLKTGIREAYLGRGEHEIAVMAVVGAAKITALNAIWARLIRLRKPSTTATEWPRESEPACG